MDKEKYLIFIHDASPVSINGPFYVIISYKLISKTSMQLTAEE